MKRQVMTDTPLGCIYVTFEDDAVVQIAFSADSSVELSDADCGFELDVLKQIKEYLCGVRRELDFAIKPVGTEFQTAVWHELMKIPYGTTVTYGDIARRIGKPGAVRAVGMACNRNNLLFIVPCHRVVGTKGDLTGFACGLNIKRYLLDLENNIFPVKSLSFP